MLLVLQTHMFRSFDSIVMPRNKRFLKLLHVASSREPATTACNFRRSTLLKFANYNGT